MLELICHAQFQNSVKVVMEVTIKHCTRLFDSMKELAHQFENKQALDKLYNKIKHSNAMSKLDMNKHVKKSI